MAISVSTATAFFSMTDVQISSQGGPAVTLYRGFQLQKWFEFHFRVKCAIEENTLESVAFQYSLGHHHFAVVHPLNGNDPAAKYYIGEGISKFIHIRKHHLYVASCMDLTLRVFTEHFELIKVIEFTATVLSFVFNDDTSNLYLGGLGYIQVWSVKHSLQDPITFGMEIRCSINDRQRVIALSLDHVTKQLIATCQDTVFIIDIKTHTEVDIFPKMQKASLTCAVFYAPMNYLITGARDGSIKVWSCLLHREIHTYTGHAKPISAIQIHPFASCFLSCSRDGTLRCWHLEAMNECFRVQTGEELFGMYSNFPCGNKILCYSHKRAYVLAIFQPEKYFITLNSDVLKVTTVTCNDKSRILALAEDGSTRLIAPISGNVISTLLPVFPSEGVQDVVYNVCESIIYVLLKSGKILVHTCSTNPCVTLENWVPSNSDEDVICIALCTINRPKHSSLLFGGLRSGYITLLHGTGLSMLHQHPAHYGCIIAMKSCQTTMLSSADLVSLGADNILKLWMIDVNECENQHLITLKCVGSIHLEPLPRHFELLGSTLCLVREEKKVEMLNIEILKASSSIVEYRNIPILSHQAEDDHVEMITCLASSLQLGLFATCSLDGRVKLWNDGNSMVSEIDLGLPLASVTFGSDHGELVVGIQKDLYLVLPLDYLPPTYHHLVRGKVDDIEVSRPFDSNVEFWYDPSRIPSHPIHQSMRLQLSKNSEDQFLTRVSDQEIHSAERNGDISNNITITLKASQVVIPPTIPKPAKAKKRSYCMHKETKLTSASAIQPTTAAMGHIDVHHTVEMSSSAPQHLPPPLPSDIDSLGAAFLQPLVADQASPSKYPIAPDCLIPNSVIRGKLRIKTCSGTIESQSSTFIPAFNETVPKKKWKRTLLRHFVPILKVPPFELLPSVAPEPISPLPSPIPSPCSLDEDAQLSIEDDKDELESSQEAVQFVFSDSWKAARDCLRGRPQIQNTEKCNDGDSTSVEAPTCSSTAEVKEEALQEISVWQNLCISRPSGLLLSNEKSHRSISSGDQQTVNHPITNKIITAGPDTCLSTPTWDKTFDTLLLQMATASDVPTFNNASSVLLDMRRQTEFKADDELAVIRKLLSKLKSNEDAAMITAELKCIQELDIVSQEVLVAVLPYLMDSRDDIRQNAFETLKRLTGITSRAQLYRRLVDIGVLKNVTYDEDEILQGVADRLKNGEVQKIPKLLTFGRATAENGMMELHHLESVSDSFIYCSDHHEPQRKSISEQPASAGSISDVAKLYEEFMNEKQKEKNIQDFTAPKKPTISEKSTKVPTLPRLVNSAEPNIARVKIKHPDDTTHRTQLSPKLQSTPTNPLTLTPALNRTAIPLLLRNRLEAYSYHELSSTTTLPLHGGEEAPVRPIAEKKYNPAEHMGCCSSEIPKQLNLTPDSTQLNSSAVIPHEGDRMTKQQHEELKVHLGHHSTATSALYKKRMPNLTLMQAIVSKFQSCKQQMLCSKLQSPVSSDFKRTKKNIENHTAQQHRVIDHELGPWQTISRSSEGGIHQILSVSHTSLDEVAFASILDKAKDKNIPLRDASLMETVVLPNIGIHSQSIADKQHDSLQVSINSHFPTSLKPLKASIDSMQQDSLDKQYASQECGPCSLKAIATKQTGGYKGSRPLSLKTKECDAMQFSGFHSNTDTTPIVSALTSNATPIQFQLSKHNTATRYSAHLTRVQSPSRIHPTVRMLLKEQYAQKKLAIPTRKFSWKDVFVLRDHFSDCT